MNRLPTAGQAQVVGALIAGHSIPSVVRSAGVAKNTVVKLLIELGEACSQYQEEMLGGLVSKRIRCNAIWSFSYANYRNVPLEQRPELDSRDVWTWVALCENTRLVICWKVGNRDAVTAFDFIDYIASRTGNPVQLSKSGQRLYLDVVAKQFGSDVDYSLLTKLYGTNAGDDKTRSSPSEAPAWQAEGIVRDTDSKCLPPGFEKHQSLARRICVRYSSPLNDRPKRRCGTVVAGLALHYMHYNFCRIDQALRITPAMSAGISDHRWSVEDVVRIMPRHGGR